MARQRGKAPSQRQLRVGEEIRHVLAGVIERGDIHDPELRDVSITVTEVRVSPDLRHATVFVLPLGGGETAGLLAALSRAASYLQARIARQTRLRFTPQLRFEKDTSFEHAERIEALLARPKVARDLGRGPGPEGEGSPHDD